MRMLLSLGLLAGVLGVATADAKKDPTAGKWVVESVTRGGKVEANLAGATRVHGDGKYAMTPPGKTEALVTGTYTVDAGKSPATIDMKPGGGQYKDKTLLGIAKLDGDTLTISFAEPGKDRPTGFVSTPGSGVVVAVFKKAK